MAWFMLVMETQETGLEAGFLPMERTRRPRHRPIQQFGGGLALP